MKERCYNPNNKNFQHYGGRGITVCNEWHNFLLFYNWAMTNGYSDNLTIDRIDVNGNYEPSNCRWVTMSEQANNKRNNRLLTYNGKTQTMTQWANEMKTRDTTIFGRLKRGNMTENEVLSKPIARIHYITFKGETKTLRQWSIHTGISYATLYCRLYKFNWDIERALTTR